jgi:putative membrane protein
MQIASFYLSLKALHIAFMVTWFAGLFYLPRLFIYHAESADQVSRDRFVVMERRLFIIMTIGAVLTAGSGSLMLWFSPALLSQGWFQLKLVMLALLVGYHLRCLRWIRLLAAGSRLQNTRWLRWFNEIPVLFLLVIVMLAVLKPSFQIFGGQ